MNFEIGTSIWISFHYNSICNFITASQYQPNLLNSQYRRLRYRNTTNLYNIWCRNTTNLLFGHSNIFCNVCF